MDFRVWIFTLYLFLQVTWVLGGSRSRRELRSKILLGIFDRNKLQMTERPYKGLNQTLDEPIEVFVSLYILNIDIDEGKQESTIQMYFRQEWNDTRVTYDPQGEINFLSLHEAIGLWTPDLFFVNEKFGQLHTVTKPNVFIRIYPEGRVLYSQRVTVKMSCPMDFRKYPFDTQICYLPIESYGYTADDIILRWKTDTTFGETEPPGFQVSYSTVEHVIYLTTNNYSRIDLGIHLDRLIHTHLIHVYIPLGLLVIASWISFFLRPKDQTPRLMAVGIIILTTLMFLQSVENFFQPLGYLTGLDIWVGFSCFLIFMSAFENIFVVAFCSEKTLGVEMNGKDVPELPSGEKKEKLMDILAGKLPGGGGDANVDAIARMTFPTAFLLFNFVYLAYYLI